MGQFFTFLVEPDPAETDCWAQGSVPKSFVPSPIPEPVIEEPETVQEVDKITEEPEEKYEFFFLLISALLS